MADIVIIPANGSELESSQSLEVVIFLNVAEVSDRRSTPSVNAPILVETTLATRNQRTLSAELKTHATKWIDPHVFSKDVFRSIFTQSHLLQNVETTSRSRSLETAPDYTQALTRAVTQASPHQLHTN